jgi:uncharacterized surface protein with fasciclin (FAS1) repeats
MMSSPVSVAGKGVLYGIDRLLVSPRYSIFDVLSNPNLYPQFQRFYQLCYQSGLIHLDENQDPLSLNNLSTGTYYTCFIPTNAVLQEGIANGTIPTNPAELQQFLRYHFVEGSIFADGEKSGVLSTTRIDEVSGYLFNTIEVINEKSNLKIKDNLGNIRNVITANLMAEDGVIHQIDSVLFFK